ncbi:MAG: carboxypeptidase regulatory-like domain-containing protein [Bacteroidales bacterium]|nr:carboxypeptidase regulatory-like domain-containing protein [Bacteroidales bacterium]
MKKRIIILLSVFMLNSCNEDKATTFSNITGTVLYEGARGTIPVDGILVTVQKEDNENIRRSQTTDSTGEYEIENLPRGVYILTASGRGVHTVIDTLRLPLDGRHDIHMTQSIIGPRIYRNQTPMDDFFDMGYTLTLIVDILNDNRVPMNWWTAASDDWISVNPESGSIPPIEQHSGFTIRVDRNKLQCNTPPATITFGSNRGSTTLIVAASRPECPGEARIISSVNQNNCPSRVVELEAEAANAVSFRWYHNGEELTTRGNKHIAVESGIYRVVGVNSMGEPGNPSRDFHVTINHCPAPPERAVIEPSEDSNTCPSSSVTLTASAVGATSFQWYRNNVRISGATNATHMATATGGYRVAGINAHGEGERSDERHITISDCPPVPARATISASPSNTTNICLPNSVILTATSTRANYIDWYKNNVRIAETIPNAPLTVTESGTYFAIGRNISGRSTQPSLSRVVNFVDCTPANPTGLEVRVLSDITLRWNHVSGATSYRVQICDNPSMAGCETNYHVVTGTSFRLYTNTTNHLFCGRNYIRVMARNARGEESSGTPTSYLFEPSINATNDLYVNFNWATRSYIIDFISSRSSWHTGTIHYDIYRRVGVAGENPWTFIDTITGHTNDNQLVRWHNFSDPFETTEQVCYRVRARIVTQCGEFYDFSNTSCRTR